MPDADPWRVRRQALRIAIGVAAIDEGMARFEMPDTFGDGTARNRILHV